MVLGTVQSIDRANQVVYVLLDGQKVVTPCAYRARRGRPNCWPLGRVAVETLGRASWLVRGPVGNRRLLFRDDFLRVLNNPYYGDTPWSVTWGNGNNGPNPSPVGGGGGDQVGGASLVGAAGFGQAFVGKDAGAFGDVDAPTALWVSARGWAANALPTATNGIVVYPINLQPAGSAGFTGNLGVASVIDVDGVAKWQLATNTGGIASVVVEASPTTLDTETWFDLIVTNQFLALSVNGSSPVSLSSAGGSFPNEPGTNLAVGYRLDCNPAAGQQGGATVLDQMVAEVVTPVTDPANLRTPTVAR